MTNSIGTVSEITAHGTDIDALVAKIEEAIEGSPRSNAIMATLAMTIWLQNPGISGDQLQRSIKVISKAICDEMTTCDLEAIEIPADAKAN